MAGREVWGVAGQIARGDVVLVVAESAVVTAMIVMLLALMMVLMLASLVPKMLGHIHAHLILLVALPVEQGSMLVLLVVLTKHAVCGRVGSGGSVG